jgi:hypothetical protein
MRPLARSLSRPLRVCLLSTLTVVSLGGVALPHQTAVTAATAAPELVVNGSFENGLTHWTGWNSAISSVSLGGAPDGSHVAKVVRTAGDMYSIDDNPAGAGLPTSTSRATYAATAWVAAAASSSRNKPINLVFRERAPDGHTVQLIQSSSVRLTPSFQHVSVAATGSGGGDVIDVYVVQSGATRGDAMYVDEIMLTELTMRLPRHPRQHPGGQSPSATPAPPRTPAPPTPTPSPTGGTRDPALWPFAVDSPWNMPIGSGAQFAPDGAAITQSFLSEISNINAGSWSHPIYVASASDPWNTVNGNLRYQIPDGARPAIGSDAHMQVIDPTHHFVDECWQMTAAGYHAWNCTYHVRVDLRSSGVGAGGVRAYGGSAIGGLIRVGELQSGHIPHALAVALDVRQQNRSNPVVWPATSSDCACMYSGSVPMGALAAIPPWVDINSLGLSPAGLVLARAAQDYGAYDTDSNNNGLTAYAEPAAEGMPQLNAMRSDWATIARQMRPVTNNTPSSVGGGGTPRVSMAPPLR